MIEKKFVDLFSYGSKVPLSTAERDVILTYALKILDMTKLLNKMLFKGGTCLRKCFGGSNTRFSLDLDFTYLEEKEPDDIIIEIASIFGKEFFDITFSVASEDFYVTEDKLSCGAKVNYRYSWGSGFFTINISVREKPILPILKQPLIRQEYFKYLEFELPQVTCFQLEELLAEKIRAAYQRMRARDIFDLILIGEKPLDLNTVRTIAVIKLWNVRDKLDLNLFFDKIRTGKYDWADLKNLLSRDYPLDSNRLIELCLERYAFLKDFTGDEKILIEDAKRHARHKIKQKLTSQLLKKYT